ncbi:EMSY N-terminal [Artemisia annua]|uniref:EMSY N-terminal n=1 Tax=Artemisia annua TaxID=35608 RepID=A0A2U1MU95_ARTAN|nr:EMSY N-terminal [Artemisia annua]
MLRSFCTSFNFTMTILIACFASTIWKRLQGHSICSAARYWTEDDNPPSHQNKFRSAGGGTVNGRTMAVGTAPFQRVPNNMEEEIHRIEQEAYSSVLRAFKAQSDAITWEMETLITDLRKELRISDEEHRRLLAMVNSDDIIMRIRAIGKGQPKKEQPLLQNGSAKRPSNNIEILHTETLVKEIDKVFSSSNADPMDIEMVRKVLKEHEQALVDAIAKLEGASDGESDKEDRDLGKISRKHEAGEGSDGNKMALEDRTNGVQNML